MSSAAPVPRIPLLEAVARRKGYWHDRLAVVVALRRDEADPERLRELRAWRHRWLPLFAWRRWIGGGGR